MRVDNIQNRRAFGFKCYVAGDLNPAIADVRIAVMDAVTRSGSAANRVIRHCLEENIECIIDESPFEASIVSKVLGRQLLTPKDLDFDRTKPILLKGIVTGKDVLEIEQNFKDGYTRDALKIPRHKIFTPEQVIESIETDTFESLVNSVKPPKRSGFDIMKMAASFIL